jgi:hypothetical protein
MPKSINIHLATGGCIMKEKIVVILTVITKGLRKAMIIARMKRKNIIRKYSKESLGKLKRSGRRKVRKTSILRI